MHSVLCFSGHDPSGGAGIQADIEAIFAMGAHACPLITCHTVQDSKTVHRMVAQDSSLVLEQFTTLIKDIVPSAVKIGLVGIADLCIVIGDCLSQLDPLPVVLDPVLASGDGTLVSELGLIEALKTHVLPRVTIATPNWSEAQSLSQATNAEAIGAWFLQQGCQALLLTGSDVAEDIIEHHYFDHSQHLIYSYAKLPLNYHGSGCTLSSAIAALLAQGHDHESACMLALDYTYGTLQKAYKIGQHQAFPNRAVTLS